MAGEVRVRNEKTGGEKGQKMARFDLVPPMAEWALAEHYGRNVGKYEERNWEKGTAWSLNYAAARRHLTAWWAGEDLDEDGASHLMALAWHAFALYTFAETHKELDDRPAKKDPAV